MDEEGSMRERKRAKDKGDKKIQATTWKRGKAERYIHGFLSGACSLVPFFAGAMMGKTVIHHLFLLLPFQVLSTIKIFIKS